LTYLLDDQEDFPNIQTGSGKTARYQPRKINHPKFKNTSAQGALDYLTERDVGDVINYPIFLTSYSLLSDLAPKVSTT
jgi:hypothetical protein